MWNSAPKHSTFSITHNSGASGQILIAQPSDKSPAPMIHASCNLDCTLKFNVQSKWQDAWIIGAGDLSEGCAIRICPDAPELCVIENVECFGAEFHIHPFSIHR